MKFHPSSSIGCGCDHPKTDRDSAEWMVCAVWLALASFGWAQVTTVPPTSAK